MKKILFSSLLILPWVGLRLIDYDGLFTQVKAVNAMAKAAGIVNVVLCFASIILFLRQLGFMFIPSSEIDKCPTQILLGFVTVSLYSLLLGVLGGLTLWSFLPLVLLVLYKPFHLRIVERIGEERYFYVALAIIVLFMMSVWMTTLFPQAQGDPLYYHLPSAWIWAREGKIFFMDWLPWSLQGGTAEYVYSWIALMTQDKFVTMILAQMLHATIGFGVSAWLVYSVLVRHCSTALASLGTLAFISMPYGGLMLVRAKNDGFVLAFLCLMLDQALQFKEKRSLRSLYFVFLAAGFAISLKHTALIFVLPFLFFFMTFTFREIKEFSLSQIIFALVPISIGCFTLVRNYIWTDNPFYPAMAEVFNSKYFHPYLLEEIRKYSYVAGSVKDMLLSQSLRFILAKPYFLLGFALPLFLRTRLTFFLMATHLTSFILVIILTGQGRYARFGLFFYAMAAILSTLALQELSRRTNRAQLYWWTALVLALVSSRIEVPTSRMKHKAIPFIFSSQSYPSFYSKEKPHYELHTWLNLQPLTGRIFSFYENENYFLDWPLSVPENHHGAAEVKVSKTYEKAFQALVDHDFVYLQIPPYAQNYLPQLTNDSRFNDDFELITFKRGYEFYARKGLAPSKANPGEP